MDVEENLRTTPSKGTRPRSTSSPSSRASSRKATKNAKITNFFTKVHSPLNKNSSNSNAAQSENEQQPNDDLSKDASSSSMKAPTSVVSEDPVKKNRNPNREYVFIIPSSDDDTNASTRGSQGRRKKPPSVHSNQSESSDGFVLTSRNNELSIGRRKRGAEALTMEKIESNSNHDPATTPTPTRSSGRDSRSRDSMSTKKLKLEHIQSSNQNSMHKITRIQPTMISCRTKMVDFQSVPSDLNMPRDQAKKLIEKLFLVKMPNEFFLFWEFAKTISHRKPCSAFSHAYLEWNLVGPYDVLSGLITDFHGFSKDNLLRHCRFYYDPPEFQTVIMKKDEHMTHYGYYRDEPNQDEPVVVMNRAALGGQIREMGDNLFTLLRSELESSIASLSNSSQEIPQPTFSSSSSRTPRSTKSIESSNKQSQLERAKAKQELTIIRDKLLDFCSTHESLSSESWSRTSARKNNCHVKTLNSIGIVVPDETQTLGVSEARLRTILTRIGEFKNDDKTQCSFYQELQQIIINKNLTHDKSNPGIGLGLGHDLFYQGDEFLHDNIESILSNAYSTLNRAKFFDILQAHLAERKKSDKVSLLD